MSGQNDSAADSGRDTERTCPKCGAEMKALLTGRSPPGDYWTFYSCTECPTEVYP